MYLVKVLTPIRLSLVRAAYVVVPYHVQRVARTGEGCFHLKCPVPKYELFAELGERINLKWTVPGGINGCDVFPLVVKSELFIKHKDPTVLFATHNNRVVQLPCGSDRLCSGCL